MSNLLEQASLVMIPSGYKEDVVYSEIPINGAGDLTFTRASDGTRINSQGLVEVVPWNLQTYSEDFSNASWSKNNSPVMAYNVATAPNGTMTADSIQSNNASVYQSVGAQTQSVAPNSTVTLSIYIKKETSKTYFTGSYLYFTGGTTKLTYVLFDEVNGTMNIIAPDEVSMVTSVESVGDWWRFIITGTDTGGNTNLNYAFYGTLSQDGTSLSPGIGSVRTIWGAQLNIGSTAKPYFPTTDRLNVPRLTYQNGGGGCPSLLLEKQSTNLQIYSEQFDLWSNTSDLTVSANASTSPDGTQNADKLNENSSNAYHIIGDANITLSASTIYTTSFFAKASERSYARMLAPAGNYSTESAYFDLTNGNCSASAGTVSTQSMGDGWYRCIWSLTTSSSVSGGIGMWFGPARNMTDAYNTYTGTNGSGIYAYGAQIEQSSYPTSYIPTTSSSATRVADGCSKTGISSLIGQTEGVMFADFVWEGSTTGSADYPLSIYASSYSDFVGLNTYENTNSMYVYVGGSNVVAIAGTTFVNGQRYKIAMAYKSNDFVYYLNGTQMGADTSGSVPSSMANFQTVTPFAGKSTSQKYNEIILFPTRLTNAELASLTTI